MIKCMNEEQMLRYLAGYIDGDGCFRVNMTTQKSGTIVYERSITVTSTCKDSINFLKTFLGGNVTSQQKKGNRKKTYTWTVKSKLSYLIALKIKNFLICKRNQCELYIKYCENLSKTNYQKVSIQNIEERNDLIYRIREDIHDCDLLSKEQIQELKKYPMIIEPSIDDYFYLSGLIDAEGCFRIVKRFRKSSNSFIYNTELAIGNVKFSIIEWLFHRFGGSLTFKLKNFPSRNFACWSIHSKSLVPIIKNVKDFLIVKKKVCQELINFQNTVLKNGGKRSSVRFKELFKSICKERDLIIERVHILNHRGK
jgi:LAGLIDADG DNA endonuclease family protein